MLLLLLLINSLVVQDQPLEPAWAPDHQTLATTKVDQAFVTPEGANYLLEFNSRPIYPLKVKHHRGYDNQHTFLTPLIWSSDSKHVAFVEKIYDWSYFDPYNRDFYGEVTREAFYIAVIGRDGQALGYKILGTPSKLDLHWAAADRIVLNEQSFSLSERPPIPIP